MADVGSLHIAVMQCVVQPSQFPISPAAVMLAVSIQSSAVVYKCELDMGIAVDGDSHLCNCNWLFVKCYPCLILYFVEFVVFLVLLEIHKYFICQYIFSQKIFYWSYKWKCWCTLKTERKIRTKESICLLKNDNYYQRFRHGTGNGSWVMRFTGQRHSGLRGSWVTIYDPISALMGRRYKNDNISVVKYRQGRTIECTRSFITGIGKPHS